MAEPAGRGPAPHSHNVNREAFAALYDRYATGLYRAALVMANSPHDAEDAVHDVFLGLWKAQHAAGQVENISAYLFASLRRALARQAAKEKKQMNIALAVYQEGNAPEDRHDESADRRQRLEQALQSLPAAQREVIALKANAGLTFAEIAAVLGIRINTAASRYRYALEKLRTALQQA